jgi:thioredoxin 1
MEGQPIMGSITELTDATFDEEIKGADLPVLVDFWAEWCGPCKMISPILEEIANEQSGRVTVRKLNVDEALEVSRRFEVQSIPTLILFKDGVAEHRIVGAKGKGQLLQELDPFLS